MLKLGCKRLFLQPGFDSYIILFYIRSFKI